MSKHVSAAALALALAAPAARDTLAEAQKQVREAETAFAKTMADRDHAAFVGFLSEEAVFLARDRALRGKKEVAEGWKAYYEAAQAPFSWAPERVEVIASGNLAVSTGPVWDPQGKRVGTFNSTWRREQDGRWRVVLDNGCPACSCP